MKFKKEIEKLLDDTIEDIVITDNDIFIKFNRNIVIQSKGHIIFNSILGNIIQLGKQIHLNPTIFSSQSSKIREKERSKINNSLDNNNISDLIKTTNTIKNDNNLFEKALKHFKN